MKKKNILLLLSLLAAGGAVFAAVRGCRPAALLPGPEARAALEAAGLAQAGADRAAREIESLPRGPFASAIDGDLFYDRENDNFRLPAAHAAKAGPSEESPEGQQILIYPGLMYKDIATGTRLLGDLMAGGLVLLDIQPVPEGMRARGNFAAGYEDMMRRAAAKNPSWRAKVERKQGLPLPAVLMTMENPRQLRLYMFGRDRFFCFRACAWTPVFDGMVRSFREGPPPER